MPDSLQSKDGLERPQLMAPCVYVSCLLACRLIKAIV